MNMQVAFAFMAPVVRMEEPTVLRIDFGKASYGQIIVSPLDDGTWGFGTDDQFQGYCGHGHPIWPRERGFPTFRDAIVVALDNLQQKWKALAVDQSGCCNDKHRAAARKGLEWLDGLYAEWGFNP